MKIPWRLLTLLFVRLATDGWASGPTSLDLAGTWSGAVDFGRFQFEMRFKVTPNADGKSVKVTMDMPGNGPRNMPCRAILLNAPDVRIEMERPAAVISGQIDEKLTTIKATFDSDDFPFGGPSPIVLKRSTEPEKPEPIPTYTFAPGETMDPRGYWLGTVEGMPGAKVRIGLKVGHLPDDTYPTLMDSFDFGGQNMPAAISVWKEDVLHLEWSMFQTSFDGKLEDGGKKLAGQWHLGDNVNPVTFVRLDKPATALPAELSTTPDPNSKNDPRGYWTGALEGDGPAVTLTLKVGQMPDKSYAASMTIAEMERAEIPTASASYQTGELRLEWKIQRATFEGKFNADGSAIVGTWEQFAPPRPLTLRRTSPPSSAPQKP